MSQDDSMFTWDLSQDGSVFTWDPRNMDHGGVESKDKEYHKMALY